ncbi:MAG: tryptophan--tRNA ligase [Alphaproteobacteria bacterium]|nr:tryptophan--tRNA ligase [Alphaproteobacteria bacterium]
MMSPDTCHLPPAPLRILSGVQPTGNLHLGNYLGAIRNWVGLQNQYECYFMLADLHAITLPQEPAALRKAVRETAAAYIACGIDAEKCAIFPQSAVSGHAELNWILSCETPLGWLNRMTQFKEKAGKDKEKAVLGLYGYPVLMAADILLYKATHVPVGEDQKQHLELSRDIAGAFNRHYGKEFFPLPEPVIMKSAARIMSLRDGTKKMSKSDESDYSRISLTDDADTIAQKFRKAKSDMVEGKSYNDESRPEAQNLLTMYAAFTAQSVEQAASEVDALNFSAFKQKLTEAAVAHLSPITAKMRELMADQAHLDAILKRGTDKARTISDATMREVKDTVGFLTF